MLVHSIATASLLLLARGGAATSSSAEASAKKTPTKIDFMRAMDKTKRNRNRKLSESEFKKELYGNTKKSSELRKKIIERSVVTKAVGSDVGTDGIVVGGKGGRRLQNYKYDATHDGTDDYLNAYGSWENKFGFDVTQYSASYHRCAEVKQFDDELAAQEDSTSVFATKHFAVFRLCPEATCMGWQEQEADCGCSYQCADAVKTNGGDSDECETACATQCAIWTQQYSMYTSQGNRERELGNSYSWDSFEFTPYYEDGTNGEVYGARGEGCQSNYGEYMIEIKEYLEIMLEWQEHRYEEYETYCETCMYKVYQTWLKNGGGRRLTFEEFKDSQEHRELGGYYGVCPEYDTCAQYQKIKLVDNWSGYFECTEVQKSNGQTAYVGPHCSQDGFTITLGVYSDENCYDYIGNGIDISSFGIDVADDALRSYYNSAMGSTFEQLKYVEEDTVCIPCNSDDIMWTNMEDDEDTNINELCVALYETSARCDKHYRVYSSKTNSAKYADAVATEDLTCDFIDSVILGNYDEIGFVNLGTTYTVEKTTGFLADNLMAQKVNQMASEVTPLQVFGLIASLMAVAILGVWAASLHNSLSKAGPWRPRRGFRTAAASPATELDRQNSGIVLGRSASNTSYYMS